MTGRKLKSLGRQQRGWVVEELVWVATVRVRKDTCYNEITAKVTQLRFKDPTTHGCLFLQPLVGRWGVGGTEDLEQQN